MTWFYKMPTTWQLVVFVLAFLAINFVGITAVRPQVRRIAHQQSEYNNLVGFVLTAHSAFFGLLLGLLSIAAYQNLSDVDKIVTKEAGYLRSIYRAVIEYPEPMRSRTLPLIREYTRYLVEDAWPQQRLGIVAEGGVPRMNKIQDELFAFEPMTDGQRIFHQQTLQMFSEMADVRRARIQAGDSGVPGILWCVVVIGLFITFVIVWLFDMRQLPHFFFSAIFAVFLGAVTCLLVALDKPIRGELSIGVEAYQAVLERMTLP